MGESPYKILNKREGPKVCVLGGGSGVSNTLRAVKTYASRITAVVSVADDGGSSGRLRDQLGISPPGDIRKCLVALSDNQSYCALFEHRFEKSELKGHALGNLILAALMEMNNLDLVASSDIAGTLLGARGRVLPATREPVTLIGQSKKKQLAGQNLLSHTKDINRIFFEPKDPEVPVEVIRAIGDADQVILGPGSLFTSVIAVCAIPKIKDAVKQTGAPVVFVCNLSEQLGETSGFDVKRHVDALESYGVKPTWVLVDPKCELSLGEEFPGLTFADIRKTGANYHDPVKLAKALETLLIDNAKT